MQTGVNLNTLIESIKHHEGFRGNVYQDTLGFDTVGYGTKMPIDEAEATLLLRHRLDKMIIDISSKQPIFNSLPNQQQEVILEMCYQLGVNGVLNFKKMWRALELNDYSRASHEMLDSKWYQQTPQRAFSLAKRMKLVV